MESWRDPATFETWRAVLPPWPGHIEVGGGFGVTHSGRPRATGAGGTLMRSDPASWVRVWSCRPRGLGGHDPERIGFCPSGRKDRLVLERRRSADWPQALEWLTSVRRSLTDARVPFSATAPLRGQGSRHCLRSGASRRRVSAMALDGEDRRGASVTWSSGGVAPFWRTARDARPRGTVWLGRPARPVGPASGPAGRVLHARRQLCRRCLSASTLRAGRGRP